MRVAIIDDGISQGSLSVPVYNYVAANGVVQNRAVNVSKSSHGTLCAKLVSHKVSDLEIVCISIYSEFDDGKEEDLLTALRWCVDHHVDCINLSNGTSTFFNNEEINDVCFQLWKQNTLIIAGISNDWKYTVPAHLPYVVSVSKHRIRDLFNRNYFVKADKRINGYARFIDRKGRSHLESHNSFACAKVTNALIHNRLHIEKGFISNNIVDFSLLKDVQIWGNESINYDLLAFSPKKIGPITNNISESILVIADTDQPKKIRQQLRKLTKKPHLIVWCNNKMPFLIRKWCGEEKINYWKVPRIRKRILSLLKILYSVKLEECFVISVTSVTDLYDLISVKKSFEEAGYTVLLFSVQRYSYLYGAIMANSLSVVRQACSTINPDVIIIDNTRNIICDVSLSFSTQLIYLNTQETTIAIERKGTGEEYGELVTKIETLEESEGKNES